MVSAEKQLWFRVLGHYVQNMCEVPAGRTQHHQIQHSHPPLFNAYVYQNASIFSILRIMVIVVSCCTACHLV